MIKSYETSFHGEVEKEFWKPAVPMFPLSMFYLWVPYHSMSAIFGGWDQELMEILNNTDYRVGNHNIQCSGNNLVSILATPTEIHRIGAILLKLIKETTTQDLSQVPILRHTAEKTGIIPRAEVLIENQRCHQTPSDEIKMETEICKNENAQEKTDTDTTTSCTSKNMDNASVVYNSKENFDKSKIHVDIISDDNHNSIPDSDDLDTTTIIHMVALAAYFFKEYGKDLIQKVSLFSEVTIEKADNFKFRAKCSNHIALQVTGHRSAVKQAARIMLAITRVLLVRVPYEFPEECALFFDQGKMNSGEIGDSAATTSKNGGSKINRGFRKSHLRAHLFEIEDAYVGLLIGRGGERIKKVENVSSTIVHVLKRDCVRNSGPNGMRGIVIFGILGNIQKAKHIIKALLITK